MRKRRKRDRISGDALIPRRENGRETNERDGEEVIRTVVIE